MAVELLSRQFFREAEKAAIIYAWAAVAGATITLAGAQLGYEFVTLTPLESPAKSKEETTPPDGPAIRIRDSSSLIATREVPTIQMPGEQMMARRGISCAIGSICASVLRTNQNESRILADQLLALLRENQQIVHRLAESIQSSGSATSTAYALNDLIERLSALSSSPTRLELAISRTESFIRTEMAVVPLSVPTSKGQKNVNMAELEQKLQTIRLDIVKARLETMILVRDLESIEREISISQMMAHPVESLKIERALSQYESLASSYTRIANAVRALN